MKEKKLNSAKVIRELIEYLTLSLDELTNMPTISPFSEGEIIAFVECLELLSKWTSYHKFGVVDIEKRFPIK